jgi:hypothetical protein
MGEGKVLIAPDPTLIPGNKRIRLLLLLLLHLRGLSVAIAVRGWVGMCQQAVVVWTETKIVLRKQLAPLIPVPCYRKAPLTAL